MAITIAAPSAGCSGKKSSAASAGASSSMPGSSTPGGSGSTAATSGTPASGTLRTVTSSPKVASAVAQVAAQAAAAKSSGADPATASSPLVHARADGSVEVSISARRAIGSAERADLTRLGVEIEAVAPTPATGNQPAGALVQAWVPAGELDAVAQLDWVAAVSTPGYPATGG